MSKKVIIESTLREGILDSLLPFLEKNLPSVRGFVGCLNVMVFLDKKSRKMIFDEEWLSVEAHQKYINAIASNGVMGELASFLEAPPEIKYLDRIDI
jgi:quinol monooxygenase YgiN